MSTNLKEPNRDLDCIMKMQEEAVCQKETKKSYISIDIQQIEGKSPNYCLHLARMHSSQTLENIIVGLLSKTMRGELRRVLASLEHL